MKEVKMNNAKEILTEMREDCVLWDRSHRRKALDYAIKCIEYCENEAPKIEGKVDKIMDEIKRWKNEN